MKTIGRRFLVLMLAVLMCFGCFIKPVNVSAQSSSDNLRDLIKYVTNGKCEKNDKVTGDNFSQKTYKTTEGGYVAYTALITQQKGGDGGNVLMANFDLSSKFSDLTTGQQQQFIKDMFTICYDCAEAYPPNHNKESTGTANFECDDATIDEFMQLLSNKAGMGSSMLAALMADVKPNYASANNIFKPFSGVIGTILALLSIIVMALVGVTMAMDICYITIPAFQLAMNGDGDGKGKSKIGGIISADAKAACSEKDNGNCTSKEALGKYFKTRVFGLVLLGICLLYLVNGQIYTFVSWLINLMSGFLGF